jgi:hypothetical protein
VEISSHYGYQAVMLAPESEDKAPVYQKSSEPAEQTAASLTTAEDRLELVRVQNLASPPPEPVDLKEALNLVRQVQAQMSAVSRQDMQELYQFDRLRDLCCKIHSQSGA